MQGLTNKEWQDVRDLVIPAATPGVCITCGSTKYTDRELNIHVDQGGECHRCFELRREVWPETLDIPEVYQE